MLDPGLGCFSYGIVLIGALSPKRKEEEVVRVTDKGLDVGMHVSEVQDG